MTDTITGTLPTSRTRNLPLAESQRVHGLSLIHDGNHWTASFLVAVRRMLDDLVVNEEPLHITVYADDDVTVGAKPDAVMRVTGKAVTADEDVITFDDGATVEIEHVISLHI